MDSQLIALNNTTAIASPEIFEAIQKRHNEVSSIETPKNEVKKDFNKMDYVEVSYMRRIADKYYPGWSWNIINTKTHTVTNDKGFSLEVGFMVHGRLTWIENGLVRQGDMTAGHANHKLKDNTGYVSISNAWKAANTECMKKAFNMFMNIADDVYKNLDTSLTQKEREELLNIMKKIDSDWMEQEQGITKKDMDDKILDGTINKASFKLSKAKLDKWVILCEADKKDGWTKNE